MDAVEQLVVVASSYDMVQHAGLLERKSYMSSGVTRRKGGMSYVEDSGGSMDERELGSAWEA